MPGKINLGGAFIKIGVTGTHLVKKAFRDINQATASLRKSIGSLAKGFLAFGAVIGTVVAAKGLQLITSAMIDFTKKAMEMEEIMARFNQAFGENAEEMKTWGDTMAKAFGRSKKDVSSMLVDMKNLFDALGWGDERANQMVKILSQDVIDAASFRDLEASDAFDRLRAALTGSSETMKLFGSILNETAIRKFADELGVAPGRLDENQKVYLRARKFHEDMKRAKALGDAMRTRGSATNSIRAMKAAWEDMAIEIGYKLLPFMQKFAQIMEWFINQISPVIAEVFENLASNASGFAQAILGIADSLLQVLSLAIKLQKMGNLFNESETRAAFERQGRQTDYLEKLDREMASWDPTGRTDRLDGRMISVESAQRIVRAKLQASRKMEADLYAKWKGFDFETVDASASALQGVRQAIASMKDLDWEGIKGKLAEGVPEWQREGLEFPDLPERIGEAVATAISKQTETSVWQKWADEVADNGKILGFMKGSLISIDRKTLPHVIMGT